MHYSQIFFKNFDHSYYNSSFKYAANKIRFSITPVRLSTESVVFQKGFFCKFEAREVTTSDIFIFPEEIL